MSLQRAFVKIGGIYYIHYGKRYPNMPHQHKQCMVLAIGKSPRNALVGFRNGLKTVVPTGNLFKSLNH